MSQIDPDAMDDWSVCAPGTLHELRRKIRSSQFRKTAVRATPTVAIIALLAVIGFWNPFRSVAPSEFQFGGVACTQVQANIQRFAMKQLPLELQHAYKEHLTLCPHCQEKMREMRGDEMKVGATFPKRARSIIAVPTHRTKPWEETISQGFRFHSNIVASLVD